MDVFVSYTHDDVEQAMAIVKYLEARNISCWIAPRDVAFAYASDIVDAISNCKVFLVVITKKTLDSTHVLNEIEQAYKYYTKGKCTIIPFFLERIPLSKAMDYYLARIQHVYATGDVDVSMGELINKIRLGIISANEAKQDKEASPIVTQMNEADEIRIANRYYDVDDKYEKKRLKVEGEMLLRFEKEIVDEMLEGKEHLNGLILCCMFAPAIMSKYGDLAHFDKMLGFCYNEKAVFEANYDYRSEKCRFFEQDVEDPEFEEKLEEYMKMMEIEKFDYIDITMGFIDWKNPFNVVKTLKKFMNKGCQIFVRDVDDGVVMSYPDESRLFAKFKTFYPLDPISGYRKSGRRIFSYFKKLHASEISLVHSGIDVTDMDIEEKEKMFFSWFGFIPNDFKISYNNDPSREDYKGVIEWCDEYYDSLEETFMGDSFFFNSGYFIYKIKM